MVPPCEVSGCAKTTAARSPAGCPRLTRPSWLMLPAAAGSSSSASSRPAGPVISRGGMLPLRDKLVHEPGEFARMGIAAEMSRLFHRDLLRAADQLRIALRAGHGHDAV